LAAISLMSCWQGGVVDLRLPSITADGDTPRSSGPAATGIFTVVGPFHVPVVAEALQALVVERIVPLRTDPVSIDAKFVLAQPWNRERTIRAAQLRQREIAAGPIRVNRVIVPDLPDHFVVLEGAHRAFAARQRGDACIDAIIGATLRIAPEQFSIVGDTLMRCTDDGTRPVSPSAPWGPAVSRDAAAISTEVLHVLASLGCAVYPESQFGVVSQCQCAGRVRLVAP